jgi:hypothetical protein
MPQRKIESNNKDNFSSGLHGFLLKVLKPILLYQFGCLPSVRQTAKSVLALASCLKRQYSTVVVHCNALVLFRPLHIVAGLMQCVYHFMQCLEKCSYIFATGSTPQKCLFSNMLSLKLLFKG